MLYEFINHSLIVYMSSELCDTGLPVVNILGAVNEIFQVLILSRAPDAPKISVSFKNKGQTCHTGLHLFCLKVSCSGSVPVKSLIEENCFPQLCKIVSEMQSREQEIQLALQLVNANDCGLQKTLLLWLEAHSNSCTTVNILTETLTNANIVGDSSTVLELRMLVTINNAIQCGKEILDLLQRIKLLNPKIQLLFSLYTLTLVEFDLCDTNSISCGTFDIFCGHDLFWGKNTANFICQTMKVKCSTRFDFPKKDDGTGAASLNCIACFIPINAVPDSQTAKNRSKDDCSQKQEIRGHLRIQLYGPANLPFDMQVITRQLALSPHSLLPWQKLGLQVKKSFSCSSYDMRCSAKITDRECVPSWATQCQHFCLVLAFIVNETEDYIEDNVFYRFYRHQESTRNLEQQTLNRTVYSTFQEAAWSCLEDLLSQDKKKSKSVKCKEENITDCQVDGSELFKKMIPDVANSLTDIFIRSTCVDFRSQVGALVPTSSRSSLSCHLEKSLWKVICKSRNNSNDTVMHDQTIVTPEVSQVDDWDFSEDSLFSDENSIALSPDSLDLDWDNAQSTTHCEGKARNIETTSLTFSDTTSLTFEDSCKALEPNGSNDEGGPCSFQQISSLSQQFDSYLSPEQEFDQWEIAGDFLNSALPVTCTSSTDTTKTVLPAVIQQATNKDQNFHTFPCPEDFQFSAVTSRLEHVSSSTNSADKTKETGTNAGTASTSSDVDKMPRKRSSEYIDNEVSLAHDDVSQTDEITDSKKQRCQNYDSTSAYSLSLQKLPTLFYTDDQDSFLTNRSGCKKLQHGDEDTNLKPSDQVEEDSLSSCWFDEEDIANWHAELDK